MPRVYLEALETVALGQEAEFVRLDITGKSAQEETDIKVALQDYMTGLTYTLTKHTCNHDAGGACVSQTI